MSDSTWTDRRFTNRDRIIGTDGNAEVTSGGADAMCREMCCDPTEVDGEPYGNYAHVRHRRPTAIDIPGVIRDYQAVADRHMAEGRVKDVTVRRWTEAEGDIDGIPLLVTGFELDAKRPFKEQLIYTEGT